MTDIRAQSRLTYARRDNGRFRQIPPFTLCPLNGVLWSKAVMPLPGDECPLC